MYAHNKPGTNKLFDIFEKVTKLKFKGSLIKLHMNSQYVIYTIHHNHLPHKSKEVENFIHDALFRCLLFVCY